MLKGLLKVEGEDRKASLKEEIRTVVNIRWRAEQDC